MILRYATAVTTGTFVTLSLFYVMQSLIAMGSLGSIAERERHVLDWTRLIKDETLVIDDPAKIDPIDPPPQLPPTATEHYGNDPIPVHRTPPATPGIDHTEGVFSPFNDGPLVAIVRVQPSYPVRAAQQALEGWVIVQYDVNPDGTVGNVAVVKSSNRIFEDAAIKAAMRFRYKARVIDGAPQTTRGVQNRFRFEMDRG